MINQVWIPQAGLDYYSVRTKSEAIQYLKQFYSISWLRKQYKDKVIAIYHAKMKSVLKKGVESNGD